MNQIHWRSPLHAATLHFRIVESHCHGSIMFTSVTCSLIGVMNLMSDIAAQPPLVSVIIPTCNREEALQRCLDSLTNQSCPSFEVIVVDDCSSDDTVAMLSRESLRWQNLRLQVIRNETHAGLNVSRNKGIRAARGRFLAFLDSDCIAEPDWLDRLVAAFTDENVAAVTGLVTDPPPSNIYELAMAGTTRVHGTVQAPRLVGGNLALRRERAIEFMFDEDPQWRSARHGRVVASPVCDEESVYLKLRNAGYEIRIAPDAVVLHEHRYDRASFFRQAKNSGKSVAFLVYKYHLPPRLDLVPFLLMYVSLPLGLIGIRWLTVAGVFLIVAISALLYNETARKGKSFAKAIMCLPVVMLYYQVRLAAYGAETVRLHLQPGTVSRIRLQKPK